MSTSMHLFTIHLNLHLQLRSSHIQEDFNTMPTDVIHCTVIQVGYRVVTLSSFGHCVLYDDI